MAEFERELNWDDEISNETGDFEPLPEGDYQFTVSKIERARSQGKGKLPPCNMAKVTLTVHGAEYDRDITVNLVLHSSLEWKLSQFFLSIGLKKHSEPLRMNWTGAVGKTGNCHVTVREYKRNDGGTGTANDISKFYAYDEVVNVIQPVQQPAPQNYFAQQPQNAYAAPAQSAQPVQPQYQQPTVGGWTQGNF